MSLWLANFQIGMDKDDLHTVGNMKSNYTITPGEEKAVARNIKGKLNKVKLDKLTEDITVDCAYITTETMNNMQSVLMSADEFLYFKPLEDGFTHTEIRTPLTVNTVQSIPTSRRFITIESVVLKSAPLGTNYGGTMDEETGLITFAAAIPAVEDVIIKYNYKGWYGDVNVNNVSIYIMPEIELFGLNFVVRGK